MDFLRGAAGFKLGAVSGGVCVFGMEVCGVAAASRGDLRWGVFDTRWIWADATWLGVGWVGFKGRRRRRGEGGGEEEGEGALVGWLSAEQGLSHLFVARSAPHMHKRQRERRLERRR